MPPASPSRPTKAFRPWLNAEHYDSMIAGFNEYEPSHWLPTIAFKVAGMMFWPWFWITVFSVATVVALETLPEHEPMSLSAHIILGGALSFLVVMRTDASMNRWWEARCAWQTISDCVLCIGAQTAPAMQSEALSELVLMQLMGFTMSCKAWLRETTVPKVEVGPRMDWQYIRRLNASHNPPVTALKALSHTIRNNMPAHLGAAIYDETSEQIRVINEAVGNCAKIRSTPMVFGYVATLRSCLILWLVTLAVPLAGEFGRIAVPVLSGLAFLYLTVEQTAVEIEQPFGDDANDLPMEKYIVDLQTTLLEMCPGFQGILIDENGDSDGGFKEEGTSEEALVRRLAALEAVMKSSPTHARLYQV